MPTNKKRVAITLDAEMERQLYNMRKTDKYCRCSLSEIIRQLMLEQLRQQAQGNIPVPNGKTA